MGTEVKKENHTMIGTEKKEGEEDGSIPPTNIEWAGAGTTLECYIILVTLAQLFFFLNKNKSLFEPN